MLKAAKVQSYFRRLGRIGMSANDILAGTNIDVQDVLEAKPMGMEKISQLFNLLGSRAPSTYGLICALDVRTTDFGDVGYAQLSAPTLRDALEQWRRYSLIAGHPMEPIIEEIGNYWHFHLRPRCLMTRGAIRFCAEVSIPAFEPFIRELTGKPAQTVAMNLPSASADSESVRNLLKSENINFEADFATYIGKRSDLDRTVVSANADIYQVCELHCQRTLDKVQNKVSIAEQVEQILIASRGKLPTLNEVARELGMSNRRLQRELSFNGRTFQSVIASFRKAYAQVLLNENYSIKAIAYKLGFEDVRCLYRAFHQWTGVSMSEWRKQCDCH